MKKVIILCMLLALSFSTYSCGGGGAGSSSSPDGENPKTPSIVKLMPSHYVAQTNSFISLHTKVLDGNGKPVQNTPVTYTNLSEPLGVISAALKFMGIRKPLGVLSASVVKTDNLGIATVKLSSTIAGFVTVQSEVNTGAGNVRDQKTVFFTKSTASTTTPPPTLTLHVDDGTKTPPVYDEPADFDLLKTSGDNTRTIKATVLNGFGVPLSGALVTFGSDSPNEVTFDRDSALTGIGTEAGNAYVVMTVNPAIISKLKRFINVFASADTDGDGLTDTAGMVTLFLEPVTVSSITVTANPSVVAPNGTSTIQAVVSLNTGTPVPDGSSVGFTTSCGMITPFGQTLGGVATATFTAPSIPPTPDSKCYITATIGGVFNVPPTPVTVTTSLTVQPNLQTINGIIGGIATFTIYGGVAPYTVTSNNTAFPAYLTDNEFTVNVGENSIPRTILYTVRDKIGDTATATLTIGGGASLAVLPSSVSVDSTAPDDTVYFTIFGGVAPYAVFSDNQAYQPIIASSDHFSILVPAGAPEETVVLTVRDETGDTATAKIEITLVPPQPLAVIPASQTIANPAINNAADYTVIGGKGPYSAFSDKPGFATVSVTGSTVTALVAAVPTEDTTVTISIYDSLGDRVNASLILDVPPLIPLAVIPTAQTVSNPSGGETRDYTVIGGTGGYTAYSNNPAAASVSVAGSVVTATVGPTPPTTDTTVTITIYDSSGNSKTATLILDVSPLIPLAVIPTAQTVSNPSGGETRDYTVIGGSGGYTAFSSNPAAASVAVAGSVVTATVGPTPPTTDTTVTITIYDSSGSSRAVTLILDVPPLLPLAVFPGSQTADGVNGETVTFTVFGGVPGYDIFTNLPAFPPSVNHLNAPGPFTITVPVSTSSTDVTYTIRDAAGTTVAANLTIAGTGAGGANLLILPGTVTVVSDPVNPQAVSFTISGGTPAYITTSTDPANAYNTTFGQGIFNGSPISVTIPANASESSVTLNVFDAVGGTTNAKLTIVGPPAPPEPAALKVNPSTVSVAGLSGTGDEIPFLITGGSGTYTNVVSSNTAVVPNPTLTVNTFTINPRPVAASTSVTLTVIDDAGATATATVTVTPTTSSLALNPSTIAVRTGTTITYNIIGGLAPYRVYSSDTSILGLGGNPYLIPPGTNPFTAVTAGDGSATITVVDSDGQTVTGSVTITAPTPPAPTPAISVTPPTATICEDNITCSAATDVALFTISGGTPPYTVTSLTPGVIPSPGPLGGAVFFTVNATNGSIIADTPVILTITDTAAGFASITITVINQ